MLPTGESTPRNEGWERQMTDHSSTACLLRLQWDETNLTLHEIEREQQEARMKIDEPRLPLYMAPRSVRSEMTMVSALPKLLYRTTCETDCRTALCFATVFDLDGAAPSSNAGGSRRGSSAAEQLAANTSANAGRNPGEGLGIAVGLDAADLARGASASGEGDGRPVSARSTSRSPSFSLPPKSPSSRRSSSRSATAMADDQRSDVRQQAHDMDLDDGVDGEVEEEDPDPESKFDDRRHEVR